MSDNQLNALQDDLLVWQAYAMRLESILYRIGIPLPETPMLDEAQDMLAAEDDRYVALCDEFLAKELPWLTPEAQEGFRNLVEVHGAASEDRPLTDLPEAPRMIDEASMWMLDWMVCGAEPFDEATARKILGNGEAYEKFAAEVRAAQAKRDARAIDDTGDVGC